MGECRSDDLRFRVVESVAAGSSRRAAPSRRKGRPVGKGPLVQHRDYLIAVIEAAPDITMPEQASRLHAGLGVIAACASLSKLLCRAQILKRELQPIVEKATHEDRAKRHTQEAGGVATA